MLRIMRIPHFKHVAGPIGEYGISDLIGTIPPKGRGFFCEVKTLKGRVHEKQWEFLKKMESAGAVVLVARSYMDVINKLSDEGYQPATDLKKRIQQSEIPSWNNPIKIDPPNLEAGPGDQP